MKGPNIHDSRAIYGNKSVEAITNLPGARNDGLTWSDNSGGLWLFGGYGFTENDSGYLNDLWKYNISTGNWTWISGDSSSTASGIYNALGIASPTSKPSSRRWAMKWKDNSGNFWLFGGEGRAFDLVGKLGDLWRYRPGSNDWTWMHGDTVLNTYSDYGIIGQAGSGTGPGAREGAATWVDNSGNLWMFGGFGFAAAGFHGYLNDMWKYEPTTNQWTWVKGSINTGESAIYGTQGIANSSNQPGGLDDAVSWKDLSGNFWLYGGSKGSAGLLNDLWKYNPLLNQWTWMRGDGIVNQTGVYGAIGVSNTNYKPGARIYASVWLDETGNLWLFGGYGFAGATLVKGDLNDLWKYNPVLNQWTWVKGDSTAAGSASIYGNQGSAALMNKPGSRYSSMPWKDNAGNLWLLGGYDLNSPGFLNDLWRIISPVTYTFIGSGDFDTPNNWLNSQVPSMPITQSSIIDINGTGSADRTGDISIEPFGTLSIRDGKVINIINGNLNNSGNLFGPGNLVFSGTPSHISSSEGITAPITLLSKQMFLTADTKTESINLTGGSHIKLDSFNLNLDTATLVADSLNYIITNNTGRLRRMVSTTSKLFHIGIDSTSYTPITISNNGIPDSFSVRVAPGLLTRTTTPDPITMGAVNRTWLINESVSGGSNLNFTIQWKNTDELLGFDRDRAFIAKVCPPPYGCDNGYEVTASSTASGTNPYTLSRNNLTLTNLSDSFIVRTYGTQYNFTGDGFWHSASNWTNNTPPLMPIKLGMEVIINPSGGLCIYIGDIILQSGGILRVEAGKTLHVIGNIIQQ